MLIIAGDALLRSDGGKVFEQEVIVAGTSPEPN